VRINRSCIVSPAESYEVEPQHESYRIRQCSGRDAPQCRQLPIEHACKGLSLNFGVSRTISPNFVHAFSPLHFVGLLRATVRGLGFAKKEETENYHDFVRYSIHSFSKEIQRSIGQLHSRKISSGLYGS